MPDEGADAFDGEVIQPMWPPMRSTGESCIRQESHAADAAAYAFNEGVMPD